MSENLRDTFEENLKYLNDPECGTPQLLGSLSQIRTKLDQTALSDLDLPGEYRRFMEYLLENSAQWLTEDPSTISRLISDYTERRFSPWLTTSMEDTLGEIPLNFTQTEHEILRPLSYRAEPLLPVIIPDVNPCYAEMTGPQHCPTLWSAASAFSYARRPYNGDGRLMITRVMLVSKLSEYIYLPRLKQAYDDHFSPDLHLHTGDINWRSTLPEIQ
jgi:hypothetical protein